jgi:hypothetical protein
MTAVFTLQVSELSARVAMGLGPQIQRSHIKQI